MHSTCQEVSKVDNQYNLDQRDKMFILAMYMGKQLKYGNLVMGGQATVKAVNRSGISIHEFIMYILRK
jgi:hypothetical protein